MTHSHISRTHHLADPRWSGRIVRLGAGTSEVDLELRPEMAVDESGLVHGGFIFSAADFAAMLAVNHPNVVLGAADVRFLRPSTTGGTLRFAANVQATDGRKNTVAVHARDAQGTTVFEGHFTCVVPSRHVLDARPTHLDSKRLEAQETP